MLINNYHSIRILWKVKINEIRLLEIKVFYIFLKGCHLFADGLSQTYQNRKSLFK